MSRRIEYPYNGMKYLLNTNTREIHDLDRETPSCKIDKISKDHIKMFDNIISALYFDADYKHKNNGCKHCLTEYHTD